MKDYLVKDNWRIIEDQYHAEYNQISESIFSIGNGQMGQRANFEESYTGNTLQGNYIGGVYYPDKTRVGWWKNGYPEYFAKVPNACDWIGIRILLDQEEVNLATSDIKNFYRELDMKRGLLTRKVEFLTPKGRHISIESRRFCSMADDEIGAIEYKVKSFNYSGGLALVSSLDFDVKNSNANYDEKFWDEDQQMSSSEAIYVTAKTRKTDFLCTANMNHTLLINGGKSDYYFDYGNGEKYVEVFISGEIVPDGEWVYHKYVNISSSRNHTNEELQVNALAKSRAAKAQGFKSLLNDHINAWAKIWDTADIVIKDDVTAQQGIRFNIFQLYQTYTGKDSRLNIGPKGFTGEKYGGSTYWDTEAYCLPFYLSTTDESVARNLLIYRHNQLDHAIANAEKLGFSNGAALYPMVTMNGEECHNEWEITFEEIHRNGAIAYAIYDYIKYTGDKDYLASHGAEVLVAIARFWAQRVNFSEAKQQYVILGVTGPNEYENNVNNNWYTNYIASWCMEYAAESLAYIEGNHNEVYGKIISKINFSNSELEKWSDIRSKMYLPKDESRGIFLQQDGFLDKDILPVTDLSMVDVPINQKWSWDRILRSCYIKQADVLQGIYFFVDKFDPKDIRRNYEFYEPLTVHESSLSPCVHSILATKLGMNDKAYEMYLRTSRLDLDDYNNDTEDGCHITSMAGTWLAIVRGFAGMSVEDDRLSFTPRLPQQWAQVSFKTNFRGQLIELIMRKDNNEVKNHSYRPIKVILNKIEIIVEPVAVTI